ncbi:hypothetical protein NOF55_00910 [Rhizobiaceae bacterium BDR2-2]|uniref:Membrane-anchored ribosome-binding protein, inhibits growth in stationary phase, ElaB/YqjD/DUF883 family n=1 Tax=Ectorhizobium quercum TaxID=2965071 RepID=A0AAE3SU45_9HYPH|nr:hypothetical protein [Ectorhizobium quercum]MCX8995664.1 hypothetical protein [Ectorhizobium quercum]
MATKSTEANIEEQIAALREQLSSLTETVSAQAGSLKEKAEDRLEDAKGGIRRAALTVRDNSHQALEAVKENPGTATSLATVAALAGFALGYLLGNSGRSTPSSNWTKHWR